MNLSKNKISIQLELFKKFSFIQLLDWLWILSEKKVKTLEKMTK